MLPSWSLHSFGEDRKERKERGRRNEGRKREGRKEKREGGDGLIVMRALRKMKQECVSTG